MSKTKIIEGDGDEIPIGIISSIILYSSYIYILNLLDGMLYISKMDNTTAFLIYSLPFILFYIETQTFLKKRIR